MFRKISGTKDILPQEADVLQQIEVTSRNIFSLYGYRQIRTPILEDAALFDRSLGKSAEIVQKQMFLIKNKEEVYALRPEGTAGIVRAYIENNLDKSLGFAKLYYLGPMFRFERPQKGRLRQFHHIGAEAIGSTAAELDAEVISLANSLLQGFGISGYKIKINSLGCAKDRKGLSDSLQRWLKGKAGDLCPDCQQRLEKNALRVLDCKNESCRAVVDKLDITGGHLCPECAAHFLRVKECLDISGISYEVSPRLVRGLDYYTRTVFEITHPDLGAQDAIGAGGRYDDLVKELGGPVAPAIGFAFGVERLLLATSDQRPATSDHLVYLITLGQEAKKEGLKILQELRGSGVACDTDYEEKSLKGAMRRANDLGATSVLIIGDDELKKNVITLKDMANSQQREISRQDIVKELRSSC
ncbi:MAG: histidine--tRNA ligase [Candidatus Omnitrophica bacterium]|nr:histidine--tRNA ligase [Candidatus Omnitrophota bacterium]